MTTRIWHLATHTTNVGDGALVSGIQSTLRQDWPAAIEFINDDLMGYSDYWGHKNFDLDFVNRVNAESNMLLIGGGGMLDGGRKKGHTGMAFNLPLHLWDKITVPMVFYAVGYNLFDGQYYWHNKKLKKVLEYISQRDDIIFSVRNDGSLERLTDAVGDIRGIVSEIPDPGLYVPSGNSVCCAIQKDHINIVLQLAGDNIYNRFKLDFYKRIPLIGEIILNRKLHGKFHSLGRMFEALREKYNFNLILCPHLVRDFYIFDKFVTANSPKFTRFHCTASPVLKGVDGSRVFFDLYRQADLVIGMRGHSVICAVGTSTPVIGLSSHQKIEGFLNKMGLGDSSVSFEGDFTKQLKSLVISKLENLESQREKLRDVLKSCRIQTQRFNSKIYELVR